MLFWTVIFRLVPGFGIVGEKLNRKIHMSIVDYKLNIVNSYNPTYHLFVLYKSNF